MNWIEAKIIFECSTPTLGQDLISEIFYDLGAKGVVLEEPIADPNCDWGEDALPLPPHYSVIGFLPENDLFEQRSEILEKKLQELKERADISFQCAYRKVAEEDWAESWKVYFWPEKITERITVKPSWREYQSIVDDEIIIELDPGMAFGTGTHPTTSMCMALLEKYIEKGNSFLDAGTGSGILMIAANKLGATDLKGVDIDETAVEIAEENLIRNNIDREKFSLFTGSLNAFSFSEIDVVTANILADVIVTLLPDLKKTLAKNGTLICSGIISQYSQMVRDEMKKLGLEILEVIEKENWVSIACTIK